LVLGRPLEPGQADFGVGAVVRLAAKALIPVD
jgi:hypothetical protein